MRNKPAPLSCGPFIRNKIAQLEAERQELEDEFWQQSAEQVAWFKKWKSRCISIRDEIKQLELVALRLDPTPETQYWFDFRRDLEKSQCSPYGWPASGGGEESQ
jgi:hypothetical protein